jgi:hypothetical protein
MYSKMRTPMNAVYNQRQITLIGRLLAYQKPELAEALLVVYSQKAEPLETDLSKIKDYFDVFCLIHNLNPQEYKGRILSVSKNYYRKLFISTMVRLYHPGIYDLPKCFVLPKTGLSKALSKVIERDKAEISRTIKENIIWEKTDDDYRERVDRTVEQIRRKEAA